MMSESLRQHFTLVADAGRIEAGTGTDALVEGDVAEKMHPDARWRRIADAHLADAEDAAALGDAVVHKVGAHLYGADLAEHKGTALSYIPNCRIYSFQVYDKNGALQCDIVPASRTSDGAIGMYDRQRGVHTCHPGVSGLDFA